LTGVIIGGVACIGCAGLAATAGCLTGSAAVFFVITGLTGNGAGSVFSSSTQSAIEVVSDSAFFAGLSG